VIDRFCLRSDTTVFYRELVLETDSKPSLRPFDQQCLKAPVSDFSQSWLLGAQSELPSVHPITDRGASWQSGLTQLALFSTIVTHRVSIQPFHSRDGPLPFRGNPSLFVLLGTHALLLIPTAHFCGLSPRKHNRGSCSRSHGTTFLRPQCHRPITGFTLNVAKHDAHCRPQTFHSRSNRGLRYHTSGSTH